MIRNSDAIVVLLAAVIFLAVRQVEDNFMSAEEQEFSGYIAKGHLSSNAISFRYGVSINGSGPEAFNGSKTWPCLRVEVPFQEGEEEKMVAVGKLIEAMLRSFGLILDKKGNEQKELPDVKKFANQVGHGLGHWAAVTSSGSAGSVRSAMAIVLAAA